MNKAKPIKTEETDFDATTESPEPKSRTKRVISRKTEHLDKPGRIQTRHLRVNEFTPKAPSPTNSRTPESKRERGDPIPRLSFNDSNMKPFIKYQPVWRNR
jgi:hypothetical protein